MNETLDAIVVLGASLRADGTLSHRASERVRHACNLHREGRAGVILFSGHRAGRDRRVLPVTEARAMAAYARTLGIPEDAVVLEEESLDTAGNAYFTERVARRFGWQRIVVVTSAAHARRAAWWFAWAFAGRACEVRVSPAGSEASRLRQLGGLAWERVLLAGQRVRFRLVDWRGTAVPDDVIRRVHPYYAD